MDLEKTLHIIETTFKNAITKIEIKQETIEVIGYYVILNNRYYLIIITIKIIVYKLLKLIIFI